MQHSSMSFIFYIALNHPLKNTEMAIAGSL